MKILNLYSGIGGNRKLWDELGKIKVIAIENNQEIANIYKDFYPKDQIIITDAHEYLKENYNKFDFIWSSPPCPTHSRLRRANTNQNKPTYPDMKLYEEIIFLQYNAKNKWIVENVISYYDPLIRPQEVGRHYFWANFHIPKLHTKKVNINDGIIGELQEYHGFDLSKYSNIDKRRILRNCVNSKLGLHILKSAFKIKQKRIDELWIIALIVSYKYQIMKNYVIDVRN